MSKTLHEAVTVHVDDTDGVKSVTIWATMDSNPRELVYVSDIGGESVGAGVFDARYTGTARNAVTDGFEYVFQRVGGWRGAALVIHTVVIDAAGDMTVQTDTFTVTDPAILAVSSVAPTPGAVPGDPGAFSNDAATAKHTPITFIVRSCAHAVIALRYENSHERVIVYDDGFQAGFDNGSGVVVIDVDSNFTLIPDGGWLGSIACLSIIAFDDLGNVVNIGDE